MTRARHVAIAIAVVLLAPVAAAEVYKWVDADGVTHFGDRPPAGAASRSVEVPRNEVSPADREAAAARHERARQAVQGASERKAQRNANSRAAAAAADQAAADCFEARKSLDILGEQLPVYVDESGQLRLDAAGDPYQGERGYIDDADRDAALDQVRSEIDRLCDRPDDPQEQRAAREAQIQSERCETAVAEYADILRPNKRPANDEIERMLARVQAYCGE